MDANRARHEAMWEEYYAALLADIEYAIELAGAASAIAHGEKPPTPLAVREREAARRAQPKVEKAQKAPRVKLSPDEKTERQRESRRRHAEKRRQAVAAAARTLTDTESFKSQVTGGPGADVVAPAYRAIESSERIKGNPEPRR